MPLLAFPRTVDGSLIVSRPMLKTEGIPNFEELVTGKLPKIETWSEVLVKTIFKRTVSVYHFFFLNRNQKLITLF